MLYFKNTSMLAKCFIGIKKEQDHRLNQIIRDGQSFSSVMTLSPSTPTILSSLRVLSVKSGLIDCQNFLLLIILYILKLLYNSFMNFFRGLTQKISLFFTDEEISGSIFPIFTKKTILIIVFMSFLFLKGCT